MRCIHQEIEPGLWKCPVCLHVAKTSHVPVRECGPSRPRAERAAGQLERSSRPVPVADPIADRPPCQHFGGLLREESCKPCQSRNGLPTVSVFSCAVHGECTLYTSAVRTPKGRVKACIACQDYYAVIPPPVLTVEPFAGPVVRNLLMFICPIAGPEWRRNLHQVIQRMALFNGQRLIAVVVGEGLESPDAVRAELVGQACEVLEFPNDRQLGEGVAFPELLTRVQSDDPNEITFYCHAKGVTKQFTDKIFPIRRWADAMYEVLLDDVDSVESALSEKAFAGAFRVKSATFPSGARCEFNWHYTGTFFWFRNQAVFSGNNWSKVESDFWGVEAWPGRQCTINESACLLVDDAEPGGLYSPDTWTKTAQPALDQWRANRIRKGQADDGINRDNVQGSTESPQANDLVDGGPVD